MNDEVTIEPARTVLHGWHIANGGEMSGFDGWQMPAAYGGGSVREHLATRRHAGLFDLSHLGRFRLQGPGAEPFALRAFTNDAHGLRPGQAQHTLLADEDGEAIDDACLYRLDEESFLLVVSAAGRARDLRWLRSLDGAEAAGLRDDSDALAQLALQGPRADAIAGRMLGAAALPEARRNRLASVSFEGETIVVARTGYTGEPVGLELFVPAPAAAGVWQRLVDLGAVPAGLDARESLRIEAGLPRHGRELGRDPDGNAVPVFAERTARAAVREAGGVECTGMAALERQRDEYAHIRRGDLDRPPADRQLSRLVQPLAVFGAGAALRAGYRVFHDGTHVGCVTSGTRVPQARFYGEGKTSEPGGDDDLRSIGFALLDASLRYRPDRPVVLEVVDDHGTRFDAELVSHHLRPVARSAGAGSATPPRTERSEANDYSAVARRLRDDARDNHEWRRGRCINLIPSEQCTSAFVDELSARDPSGRYNEHNRLRSLGPGAPEVRYYKGTAFIMEKEEELKAALRALFGCTRVEARVVSGQMANDTVYDALKQFRNRRRAARERGLVSRVLVHDLTKGGHLSAQVTGALKNYVANDPVTGRPAVEHFPFVPDQPHRIDVEATKRLIARTRPELIVFGRSVIVHREPVREIAGFVHAEFGADDPQRPFIMYDAAHVLGLLGPHFQDPLAEGADVVTGSTHKTYFGPQRGVILSNIGPGSAFEDLWRHVEMRAFPGHVSNHHLGTMLGLLGATYEMLAYRDEYPPRVIANAKAFARGLHDAGMILEGDPCVDFTETHQVLLRGARSMGEYLATLFEANNVITNPQAFHDDPGFAAASGVRMGTPEMTRYGMGPEDFRELAGLLAEIARDGADRPAGHWRGAVTDLRGRFLEMQYCL